ncbi:O-methyltransferase [Imtechella halotolerans]|uniref:O-methyltransferase family protein n=1 Tax=Imtechella halotolerans K1 TaxID=946077 RepID=I0WH71_9FLAO|nr:O-methyltransferase [Imtechella halotolerans]EID75737.1 O-methyltransferase family protein [Imtechella halotolerans K1]WMQ63435.1 O-methyltransferase [Imtechella halotolerans]
MHFLSDILEKYVADHSENEPLVLQELSRETHLKVLSPRMLSGHFQGRVLSILSKLISPKTILEIGTYTGYSAICLAEGLHQDGILHTIDINEELSDMQRRYFDKSGFGQQIIQHTGDALKIIPTLKTNFDLVFIDADKQNYTYYFDLIIEKMNPGGIILSDNVLWSGKVVEPVKKSDKSTVALLAYNQKLKDDPRVETVLLPIRDGLTICRVK